MGITNMITNALWLDLVPGGVMPELHLKQDSTSASVKLLLRNGRTILDSANHNCVVRGIRPDGSGLFFTCFTRWDDGVLCGMVEHAGVEAMSAVPGKYRCTLTILNTDQGVTRETYKNYDFLTVLSFTVIVHEKAGRDTDAQQDV